MSYENAKANLKEFVKGIVLICRACFDPQFGPVTKFARMTDEQGNPFPSAREIEEASKALVRAVRGAVDVRVDGNDVVFVDAQGQRLPGVVMTKKAEIVPPSIVVSVNLKEALPNNNLLLVEGFDKFGLNRGKNILINLQETSAEEGFCRYNYARIAQHEAPAQPHLGSDPVLCLGCAGPLPVLLR